WRFAMIRVRGMDVPSWPNGDGGGDGRSHPWRSDASAGSPGPDIAVRALAAARTAIQGTPHTRLLAQVEKPFRVQCRHAAESGRRDRLAVDLIGHVAGSEHARHRSLG